MNAIRASVERAIERVRNAERKYGRAQGSVSIVGASKMQSAEVVAAAAQAGISDFGENYLQEAARKIEQLPTRLIWHFIGAVQTNKTRGIAATFQWVHTIERLKIAARLSEQRPAAMPPLDVLIQVNVSGESTKSGVALAELEEFAGGVAGLPRLNLRGLMTLPAPATDSPSQRRAFAKVARALEVLQRAGLALDTLSMGTSDDFEAAIAEGATMVRLGTALFGPRGAR